MSGRAGGRVDAGGAFRGGPAGGADPATMVEVALHEFHEDLALRPEQEPLFEAYANSIRAVATDLVRERQPRASVAHMSVAQRIDRNVDTMWNRLAAIEETADAAKALLSSLSPEQQGLADARLANLMLLPLAASSISCEPGGTRGPGARGGSRAVVP
jgi:hypothetical protein